MLTSKILFCLVTSIALCLAAMQWSPGSLLATRFSTPVWIVVLIAYEAFWSVLNVYALMEISSAQKKNILQQVIFGFLIVFFAALIMAQLIFASEVIAIITSR